MELLKSFSSRVLVVLVTLYNASLFLICSLNLTANNFVLKPSRFYPIQLLTVDFLQIWIFLSPLLLPIWWKIFQPHLPSFLNLRSHAALFATILIASVITAIPFEAFDLSQDRSFPPGAIFYMIRDGIAQPTAFFSTLIGLTFLISKTNSFKAQDYKERYISYIIFTGFVGGIFLKWLFSGAALPRLEDEVAYHIQSLIFEAGLLKAKLVLPPEISAIRASEILSLPFVMYDGLYYYSAHMHGWSGVLALFGSLGLKSHANLLFSILNFPLFYFLARSYFKKSPQDDRAEIGTTTTDRGLNTALLLFACSPILLFLSNTFMAHTASLTLSMALLLIRKKLLVDSSSHSRIIAGIFFTIATGIALMFIRPQVLLPIIAAIVAYEFTLIARTYFASSALPAHGMPRIFFRLLLLTTTVVIATFLLRMYNGLFSPDTQFLMSEYMARYLSPGCQSLGFGEGFGCFPTYGTMGHSFRKFLLNTGFLLSRYNQELAPGGMPLLIVMCILILRNLRRLLRGPELLFLLILLCNAVVFSLYFHNGGESYRGRYLADTSFAFYLLLGLLVSAEIEKQSVTPSHLLIHSTPIETRTFMPLNIALSALLILMPTYAILQIRGEYFNAAFGPFAELGEKIHFQPQNSLISVRDSEYAGSLRKDGFAYFPDEFHQDSELKITRSRVKNYLNLGYPTLVATATKINQAGIPEDRNGNILLGQIEKGEIEVLRLALNKSKAYSLQYLQLERGGKLGGLRKWRMNEMRICRIDRMLK